MNKYIIGIDGMRCGMCEAHVNNAIRNNLKVVKSSASHSKNQLMVITELELSIDDFKKVLDPIGYIVTSFDKTEAVKKFLGWK